MSYFTSISVFVKQDKSFDDTTTLYDPGRILMFSTLKLNTKSFTVSPTVTEKWLDVSFFLSRTTILIVPFSPITDKSGT